MGNKIKNLKSCLKSVANKVLDICFPSHLKCIFCGAELNENANNDTCENCLNNIPFITKPCLKCGAQLSDNEDTICFNCKRYEFDFDRAKSVFCYTKQMQNVMYKYKYSNCKYLSEPFAGYLSQLLSKWEISPDIITSVPIHKNRLKKRGYNQSKLMAQILADNHNVEYKDLCAKIVDNVSQTQLNFSERKKNVENAYEIIKPEIKSIKDKIVLIVDDVFTTGATINQVSKTIKEAGAKEVYAITLAHVQLKEENN